MTTYQATAAVLATDQLRDTRGYIAMGRTVEAVAADAELLGPLVRNRIHLSRQWDRLVKRCLERRDLRDVRQLLAKRLHRSDVRRIVRRGDVGELLHRRDDFIRDAHCAGGLPAVDGFEADRGGLAREILQDDIDHVTVRLIRRILLPDTLVAAARDG